MNYNEIYLFPSVLLYYFLYTRLFFMMYAVIGQLLVFTGFYRFVSGPSLQCPGLYANVAHNDLIHCRKA